jgi:hypothetical protein
MSSEPSSPEVMPAEVPASSPARGLIVLAAAVALLVMAAVSEPARVLLFGWIQFLVRVLPQVTVFWPSVIAGGLALVLLLIGIHVSGRGLLARQAAPGSTPARWKLCWTFSIAAGVFVLFAAGIALVALTHQLIWLAGAKEPMYGTAYKHWHADKSRWQLRQIGLAVLNWSDTSGSLPPGGSFDEQGRPLHSWQTHILPYLNYYAPIDRERPWTHPENAPHFRTVLPAVLNLNSAQRRSSIKMASA